MDKRTEAIALDPLRDGFPFHSPICGCSHALHGPLAKYLLNRPLGQYCSVYIYDVYKKIGQNLIPET